MGRRRGAVPALEFAPGARCPDCDAPYCAGLDAWYRACAPRLRGLIRSWGCGPHLDADDIVQDTFANLAVQLRTVENPGAWLITVARRITDRSWKKARQVAVGDADDLLQDDRVRVRWTSLARRADLETSLAVRTALRSVATLPDRQRIALYLSQVEGWTHAEIAEYLEIAPRTVAVHVYDARTAMRRDEASHLVRVTVSQGAQIGNGNTQTNFFDNGVDAHPPVWVWCRCWTGEPQRWRQRKPGADASQRVQDASPKDLFAED
jgi:RNA polymerase sigma factor (sigma-70 family)